MGQERGRSPRRRAWEGALDAGERWGLDLPKHGWATLGSELSLSLFAAPPPTPMFFVPSGGELLEAGACLSPALIFPPGLYL